jgi:hypothetical protein
LDVIENNFGFGFTGFKILRKLTFVGFLSYSVHKVICGLIGKNFSEKSNVRQLEGLAWYLYQEKEIEKVEPGTLRNPDGRVCEYGKKIFKL